jgi:hypothetical protein
MLNVRFEDIGNTQNDVGALCLTKLSISLHVVSSIHLT